MKVQKLFEYNLNDMNNFEKRIELAKQNIVLVHDTAFNTVKKINVNDELAKKEIKELKIKIKRKIQ